MASVTITIPDTAVARVLAASKTAYNYDPATDGPQAAFVKTKLLDSLREMVVAKKAKAAAEVAWQAAADAAKAGVRPT